MKKAAYFGSVLAVPSPNTEEYATVPQTTHEPFTFSSASSTTPTDPLTEVIRQGARTLLAQAVEAEVAAWIDGHAHLTDAAGRRQVVRNGHADPRKIITGVGPIEVARPRVHDRRPPAPEGEHRERFTSKILPPYLRKARAIAPGWS